MTLSYQWWLAAKSAVIPRNSGETLVPDLTAAGNGNRRFPRLIRAGVAFGALALGSPVIAADIRLPVKAPYQSVFDWTGLYIGGHTGFGRGSSVATLSDPAASTTGSIFSGVVGGLQAGYNVRLPSGLLLGVET